MDNTEPPSAPRLRIAVLCTRDSRGLPSEDNTAAARDVARALRRLGHAPTVVPMRRPPPRLRCDAVFNLCEGIDGDARLEPTVAAWLDLLGIPFTGNRHDTLLRALDKAQSPGPSPRRLVAESPCFRWRGQLRFPVIVKPRFADASLGIRRDSVVDNLRDLRDRVTRVVCEFGDAVVEEYVDGREFNVAVTDDGVLAVSEIRFSMEPRIVTYDGKWDESSEDYRATVPVCPAKAPASVGRTALAAARTLGCRGYARVDLRMDARGRLYVLEVNPNPDLSRGAGMARAAAAAGWTYEELIGRILGYALREAGPVAPPGRGGDAADVRRVHGEGNRGLSGDRGSRPREAEPVGL
jgi:D-alanine-D-alanine ligase